MPGSGRMSAIGFAGDAELYVTQIRHPPNLPQPLQHVGRDPLVHGQDHHRVAPRGVASHLHARDVHVVLAQDAAHLAHDAGPVLVPADEEAAVGYEVDTKQVDPHDTRLTRQNRPGDVVVGDAYGDEARVTGVCAAAPLDELDAPIARREPRIDGVDPLFGEGLQPSLDRGRREQVDVVVRQLAFEVELDRAHAAAEQLGLQGR